MRAITLTTTAYALAVVLSGCAPSSPQDSAPESASPGDAAPESQAAQASASPSRAATTLPAPEPEPTRASEASWDPDSIHVLVNRQNPLQPQEHAPDDLEEPAVRTSVENALYLRAEAAHALEELFETGLDEGVSLAMTSAYRSYESQRGIYSTRHIEYGTESTDEQVARPGYSEHQTGLAADVISIDNPDCISGDCFADTDEGQWVAQNAHDFGFVIRYPEDMEHITGYLYEPWHLRYVGEETATEVFAEDVTLEEYWEQPAAAEYDQDEPDPEHLTYLD